MDAAATVGILAGPQASREPRATECARFEARIRAVNLRLKQEGLPKHREPEDCEFWSHRFFEEDFHRLRRFAAYLAFCGEPPRPAVRPAVDDPLLAEYCKTVPVSPQPFEHLASRLRWRGCWLPMDFERSFAGEEGPDADTVGSVVRLQEECSVIAKALEIPDRFEIESASGRFVCEQDDVGCWRTYPREALACVVLDEACRRALESGAAIWCESRAE